MNDNRREVVLAAYGVSYQRDGHEILNSLSLELHRGQIIALIGPNGAGKSTLLKLMSGLIPLPSAHGQILLNGESIRQYSPISRARQISYVGVEPHVDFPLSSYDAVQMGRLCWGKKTDLDRVQWAMEKTQCWSLRNRNLFELSGGQRQLVAIARALAQESKILLLDEAVSNMDLNHQAIIGDLLRSLSSHGYSVIWVSHDLNLATEWADDVCLIKNGEGISMGPVSEVMTSEQVRKAYPSVKFKMIGEPIVTPPKLFSQRTDQK